MPLAEWLKENDTCTKQTRRQEKKTTNGTQNNKRIAQSAFVFVRNWLDVGLCCSWAMFEYFAAFIGSTCNLYGIHMHRMYETEQDPKSNVCSYYCVCCFFLSVLCSLENNVANGSNNTDEFLLNGMERDTWYIHTIQYEQRDEIAQRRSTAAK